MNTSIIPVNQHKLHIQVDIRGFGSNRYGFALTSDLHSVSECINTICLNVYQIISNIPIDR